MSKSILHVKMSAAFLMLFLCVVMGSACVSAKTVADGLDPQYKVIIDDEDDLLTDAEKTALVDDMMPLSQYGNVIFWTIGYKYGSQDSKTTEYLNSISTDVKTSSALFLIDMGDRQLYIRTRGELDRYIGTSNAYTITNNVSYLATQRRYAECAAGAFGQMYSLTQGARVPSPMRYICGLLMAISGALVWAYKHVHKGGTTRVSDPTYRNRSVRAKVDFTVSDMKMISQTKTDLSSSSCGSGGSGCGGGGGGSSCGGGGGSGF